MTGSAPNEEGLRALGRTIDGETSARRARRRGPAHARRDPAASGRSAERGDPGELVADLGGEGAGGGADAASVQRGGGTGGTGSGSAGGSGSGSGAGGAGTGGSGAGLPRPGKRRWPKRTLLISLAVIVLAAGAGAGFAWYLNHKIHRISVDGLTSGQASGKLFNTQNILMVGSTTRCGLAKQTPAYGLCTQGVTGVNSDVVMILHLNGTTGAVSILSIPRDLFIPNARSTTGAYKIDAALAQGPSQLVAAVEEDFAIPIQHYVELTFDSFAAVVTSLGGITMTFPDGLFDRYSGLRVLSTGCHHLNGVQALQVVRARHLQYWVPGYPKTYPYTWPQEGLSDLARIVRDHEFLRVLAAKMAHQGLGNPGKDLSLIDAVAPHLTVDSGFSATDMVDIVLRFHHVNINQAPTTTLPVDVATFGPYLYQGATMGDVEFPAEPADHASIDALLGLAPGDNTMTGKPLPAPTGVRVSVLDGTGVAGQATQTAAALHHLGFDTVGTGSATPVGSYRETTVTYAHRTPADVAAAQLVADSLSGQVILHYGPTADGAQVTVTTGTAFHVDATLPGQVAPAHPTTSTARSSSPPSTSSSSASSSSSSSTTSPSTAPPTSGSVTASTPAVTGFAPTTPSHNALTYYDPRACKAGVVGNTGNF